MTNPHAYIKNLLKSLSTMRATDKLFEDLLTGASDNLKCF